MVPRYSFPLWMLHRLCTILGPDVTPKNIFDRLKTLVPHHFQKYHGSHTDTDGWVGYNSLAEIRITTVPRGAADTAYPRP
jgi:hypothetical protein